MRLYTLYLRPLGEITLHLDTVSFSGRNIFMNGYDSNHERILFTFDKFNYPEDVPSDYGYCHITSYMKGGICTPCNTYKPVM